MFVYLHFIYELFEVVAGVVYLFALFSLLFDSYIVNPKYYSVGANIVAINNVSVVVHMNVLISRLQFTGELFEVVA